VPRRVSSPEFIGRGPELAALFEALDRATGGTFTAVFLAGEAGVGKSRLLSELKREGDARGVRVLAGDCLALGEGELPYAPIRSALRTLNPDDLDGPGRAELARLAPQLGPARADAEPLAQIRLFDLLLGSLARLTQDAPVVLAIEDIHWGDRSTLDLLAFLIATARHERLLLVCTVRTDAVHRQHPLRPWLAEHERRPAVERIDLRPFGRDELRAQLHGILGSAPDAELVTRLYERTDGNAFFAEELLAASERGTDLPASLRDALLLRVDALSEQAQRVLRLSAAHGRFIPNRLLASACGLPAEALDEALGEAVTHHVLTARDAETYAFRHALVRETLEAELLPGERIRLHLALAEALDADPCLASGDGRAASELYHHWLGAGRMPEALAAAVRAGVEAEEVSAYAEARRHFESALELWDRVDDAPERAGMDADEVAARAAEAAYLSGDGPEALRLIRMAIEAMDPPANPYGAAILREHLGRYLFFATGDTENAQRAYEDALALLPPCEPRQELARVLAALARILMLRMRTADSVERCEQALAVARSAGARAEEAHALNTLGVNRGVQGDRRTGIDHLRESLRMAEGLGDPVGIVNTHMNLADALDQDGQYDISAQVALAGAERASEFGLRGHRFLLQGEAALRLIKLGRLDEADRLTEAALELGPSVAKLNQSAARARIEVHRGRFADAEAVIAAAEKDAPAPSGHWIEPLASARLQLELARGSPVEARRRGKEAVALAADHESAAYTARLYPLTAQAGAVVAERARAEGDGPAAAAAAESAEALAERLRHLVDDQPWIESPPPELVAYRDLCAAEARRACGTATSADWAAVAERWAELGVVFDEAYARLREAECFVAEGERRHATDAVVRGLRLTEVAGEMWLHDQLEALARRARLPVEAKEAPAADAFGLTDRERAVLELVAAGRTNREIGEELYISQKTASVHVSRILAKLDVSSRVEAATAAQRLGLVP